MLQLGASQAVIARSVRIARNSISRLWDKFQTTGSTADGPRSGRLREKFYTENGVTTAGYT